MLITTISRRLHALQFVFVYVNACIHVIAQSCEHVCVHPLHNLPHSANIYTAPFYLESVTYT